MLSLKQTDLFLPLRLGAAARSTLQEFVDIDVTASDLVEILRKNPVYRELFARYVQRKVRVKEDPTGDKAQPSPTHRLIGLLGMFGSRNLVVSLRMHRAIHGTFPLGEDGSLDIRASDYLKRSLQMEEVFTRRRLEYSETAFASALLYDWMEKALAVREEKTDVDLVFRRAVRTGLIAYYLAPKLKLSPRQALAAGFSLPAGRLLLAQPHHQALIAWEQDDRLNSTARLVLERTKFDFSFDEVSAQVLQYFDLFWELAPVVRHYREPYLFKGSDQSRYRLASLLLLADNMALSWKVPAGDQDPLFGQWSHPSSDALKISRATLIEVMKTAIHTT